MINEGIIPLQMDIDGYQNSRKVEEYLQKVYIYIQYLHPISEKLNNTYSRSPFYLMKKNQSKYRHHLLYNIYTLPHTNKQIPNNYQPFQNHPNHLEDFNQAELSSVDTLPKLYKHHHLQTSPKDHKIHQEKSTQKSQEHKIRQPSDKELWLAQMKFDHFFQTLIDHPEDPKPALLPFKETSAIFNQSQEHEDSLPLLSRKKSKDNQWGSLHMRSKLNYPASQRRKSSRLEQLHQKQRLQKQIRDMRCSYFRGKYRYEVPSVRFRLSFLQANCVQGQQYDSQTIENIPFAPINQLLAIQQRKRFINKKLLDLQSRIVIKKIQNCK